MTRWTPFIPKSNIIKHSLPHGRPFIIDFLKFFIEFETFIIGNGIFIIELMKTTQLYYQSLPVSINQSSYYQP
jgi:hypothetical protein